MRRQRLIAGLVELFAALTSWRGTTLVSDPAVERRGSVAGRHREQGECWADAQWGRWRRRLPRGRQRATRAAAVSGCKRKRALPGPMSFRVAAPMRRRPSEQRQLGAATFGPGPRGHSERSHKCAPLRSAACRCICCKLQRGAGVSGSWGGNAGVEQATRTSAHMAPRGGFEKSAGYQTPRIACDWALLGRRSA